MSRDPPARRTARKDRAAQLKTRRPCRRGFDLGASGPQGNFHLEPFGRQGFAVPRHVEGKDLVVTGITCSVRRAGNVRNNSAMTNFVSSLKPERTAREVYRARDDVFDRIELFYNPPRRQSKPGYLNPIEREARVMPA